MDTSKSIIEKVCLPINGEPFFIDVKRDDLIDPIISGNKWRKLKYNILQAKYLQKKGILTFGGAYSNHLVATAKATKNQGLKSIGIIRGEELNAQSNKTLTECADFGMELHFISRKEFKMREEQSYLKEIKSNYSNFYIVPEGGKNFYGAVGCQEIIKEPPNNYDHIYLAGGTGTTATGILMGSKTITKVHLVSALKGNFLLENVKNLLQISFFEEEVVEDFLKRLITIEDVRFGGFAKVNGILLSFLNKVYKETSLPLDPIYTGKAFFQLIEDAKNGVISPQEKILFIHTGGLQGARSWKDKLHYL